MLRQSIATHIRLIGFCRSISFNLIIICTFAQSIFTNLQDSQTMFLPVVDVCSTCAVWRKEDEVVIAWEFVIVAFITTCGIVLIIAVRVKFGLIILLAAFTGYG